MNEIRQDATPVFGVAASVQLPDRPNDPAVGEEEKLTDPVGVVAPLEAVSVTAPVQVVGLPGVSEAGEHETLIAVASIEGGVVTGFVGVVVALPEPLNAPRITESSTPPMTTTITPWT